MHGKEARALRILAEYLEPKSRFEAEEVEDTRKLIAVISASTCRLTE